ncbi:hypothetical protein BDZ89DRAFT_967573 [Hymenopellis radicata]|nr:hypothetical protein BDZ89DRAFT_967573 [Hymenopellis radicata]
MAKVPVATSELVGAFLEAIGYGIYLVVSPQCVTALRRKYASISTITLVYFSTTMFVTFLLITMHIAVDLTRTFQAFTANLDVGGSSELYFATVDTSLNMAKTASYVSVTLLADILVIYRTYVVCARKWWVLPVPLLLFGVDFAMSVWFTWSINKAHPGSSVLLSTVWDRSKYFYIATLVLNWYCTISTDLVISLRIWGIQRALNNYATLRMDNSNSALAIILESAAIYSVALVCLIGTSAANSSTMFCFLNSVSGSHRYFSLTSHRSTPC